MVVYLSSLLLQLLHLESKQSMLAGLRSSRSKSLGAGKKVQLLCFNPVSLKARTNTSESKTGKWRKHPAKENNFFCLEGLR